MLVVWCQSPTRTVLELCCMTASAMSAAGACPVVVNAGKTQLIWFRSRTSLAELSVNELDLQAGIDTIHPATSVHDLGALLDCWELTMSKHVSKVASVCFFQLRRLRQMRRVVGCEVTAQPVSAFVLARLDYCNSVLAGLSRSTSASTRRLETIRLCNTGVEAATLVAHRTPHQVQTVPADAFSAHQHSATVSDRHRRHSGRIQHTARSSIC